MLRRRRLRHRLPTVRLVLTAIHSPGFLPAEELRGFRVPHAFFPLPDTQSRSPGFNAPVLVCKLKNLPLKSPDFHSNRPDFIIKSADFSLKWPDFNEKRPHFLMKLADFHEEVPLFDHQIGQFDQEIRPIHVKWRLIVVKCRPVVFERRPVALEIRPLAAWRSLLLVQKRPL